METVRQRRASKKKTARKTRTTRSSLRKTPAKKDISASYNYYKEFEGKQYTGMQVGRSHNWYYDKGEWKETKITPDLWEIKYSVIKRRKGKAPEGSGVPVGTGYHWYILAYQDVSKLNANDYTTVMTGLKYKLAHKRADKGKWNTTLKTQRKRLAEFLRQMASSLEQEPVPIEFEYKGEIYKGEAVPLVSSCHDRICDQHDVTLSEEHLGIIYCTKSGWKMKSIKDQKFVDAIGNEIMIWYE